MKDKKQKRLQFVRARLIELNAAADVTEEITSEIDTLLAEGESLETEIRSLEEQEARSAAFLSRVSASANALPVGGANPGQSATRQIVIPAQARRATRHFQTPEQAFGFGQFVRAAIFRNQGAAQWLRDHGYELQMAETRNQIEGDNTAGGYLVPSEFGAVLDALVAEYGVIRQYATESIMSRDTKDHPKRPMLLSFRPGSELGSMTSDVARFGNVQLTAKKAYLLLRLSSELSEDAAISVADELAMVIAESAAYTEDLSGFQGDGTSTYFGIEGVCPKVLGIASNAGIIAAGSGIDTYAEVTRANLLSVKSKLPAAAYANGDVAWYCTQNALTNVFERLALEAGGATAAEVLAGATPRFLGFPVRTVNAMTDTETDQSKALVFGSLRKGVVFGNRRQLTVVSSEEAGFLTDSQYIRATERFDIAVHEPGTSSAAGALIVLKFGA